VQQRLGSRALAAVGDQLFDDATSPIAAACLPSIRRLVNINSLAVERPTRSGNRTDIPQIGTRPHWPWVSPSFVESAAISRSQASASRARL
jgi:hypothetical protein